MNESAMKSLILLLDEEEEVGKVKEKITKCSLDPVVPFEVDPCTLIQQAIEEGLVEFDGERIMLNEYGKQYREEVAADLLGDLTEILFLTLSHLAHESDDEITRSYLKELGRELCLKLTYSKVCSAALLRYVSKEIGTHVAYVMFAAIAKHLLDKLKSGEVQRIELSILSALTTFSQ